MRRRLGRGESKGTQGETARVAATNTLLVAELNLIQIFPSFLIYNLFNDIELK
jgi:hypothetical protein